MFTTDEVKAIHQVVQALARNAPSKATLEWLAQVANEPDWTVAAVCLAIENLAAGGKLAPGEEEHTGNRNPERAEKLQGLMRLLGEENVRGRRRRAYALRTISKLCR